MTMYAGRGQKTGRNATGRPEQLTEKQAKYQKERRILRKANNNCLDAVTKNCF